MNKEPEKLKKEDLFDETKYNTLLIGDNKKEWMKNTDSIVHALLSEKKEIKSQVLSILRELNEPEILLNAIDHKLYDDKKDILIAACWESGIDYSAYLNYFVKLITVEGDYLSVVEVCTVIEQMEGPFEKEIINRAIEDLNECLKNKREFEILLSDLLIVLKNKSLI